MQNITTLSLLPNSVTMATETGLFYVLKTRPKGRWTMIRGGGFIGRVAETHTYTGERRLRIPFRQHSQTAG